jgi:hypothetical protein
LADSGLVTGHLVVIRHLTNKGNSAARRHIRVARGGKFVTMDADANMPRRDPSLLKMPPYTSSSAHWFVFRQLVPGLPIATIPSRAGFSDGDQDLTADSRHAQRRSSFPALVRKVSLHRPRPRWPS